MSIAAQIGNRPPGSPEAVKLIFLHCCIITCNECIVQYWILSLLVSSAHSYTLEDVSLSTAALVSSVSDGSEMFQLLAEICKKLPKHTALRQLPVMSREQLLNCYVAWHESLPWMQVYFDSSDCPASLNTHWRTKSELIHQQRGPLQNAPCTPNSLKPRTVPWTACSRGPQRQRAGRPTCDYSVFSWLCCHENTTWQSRLKNACSNFLNLKATFTFVWRDHI